MGNWNVSIKGVGPHHNGNRHDVETQAAELVRGLITSGHTLTEAKVEFDPGKEPINPIDHAAATVPPPVPAE